MSYTPINWNNDTTPINETNLNKMDQAIAGLSNEVDTVEEQIEVVKNNVFARIRAVTDIDALDLPYAVLSTAQASTGTFPLGASKIGVIEVIKRTDQYTIQRYTDVGVNAIYLRWYFADETGWRPWEKLATQSDINAINSRLAYKDISSSIDVGETGCTKVAYVENGQVIVRITYPAGAKGDKRLSIDTAYTPRMTVYGSANGNASDFGKLTTSWISPEGIIFLHATDAPATDMTATFTYPLKSS